MRPPIRCGECELFPKKLKLLLPDKNLVPLTPKEMQIVRLADLWFSLRSDILVNPSKQRLIAVLYPL